MNIALIGGGSLRILPIVRSWLGNHNFLRENGSIRLIDRCLERAEAVGRMIQRCPEYRHCGCSVVWTDDLDRGLAGVDLLYVTMEVERNPEKTAAYRLSRRYGFLCSDQLSMHGAFLPAQAGGVILDFARRLERLSPHALMLIFANPVSVFSAMVNNHTRIRALGICEGFHNHKWDIPRLLGQEGHRDDIEVIAAGVNHLSFVLSGTVGDRDLRRELDAALRDPEWHLPEIEASEFAKPRIEAALRLMRRLYLRYGTLIFSSEGDGLAHLDWEEVGRWFALPNDYSERNLEDVTRLGLLEVEEKFSRFAAEVKRNDDTIWDAPYMQNSGFGVNEFDISNPILAALSGGERFRITASAPNQGAVAGFGERDALEYTMEISAAGIEALPGQYIPSPFRGMIAALSEFQTLQADAVATGDSKLFIAALEAYPMWREDKRRAAYYRELAAIYHRLPAPFDQLEQYY